MLYLAATRSEVEVATALSLLLESHQIPKAEAVTALVQPVSVPQLTPVIVNLCVYDALLSGQEVAYG